MRTIQSLLEAMENTFEDLYYFHKEFTKKLKAYNKINESFDDNHQKLLQAIDNNSNAMSGIYKNAHLQKQIDMLRKIIEQIPADVRVQYVQPHLLEILGD